MGLREKMMEKPGPKGCIVQDPEFEIGDQIKINPEIKDSVLRLLKLDLNTIFIVKKVHPHLHRSCRLDWDERSGCASHCKHFEECLESDDEIYADWVIGQILTVTSSGVSRGGLGSCLFVKT
ncbi:MAG: hypothetical protein KAJ39_01695 [Gammaproteobacteria bacterium]|nr:hypothetical protein [Gammaproteobacteria bacterium]